MPLPNNSSPPPAPSARTGNKRFLLITGVVLLFIFTFLVSFFDLPRLLSRKLSNRLSTINYQPPTLTPTPTINWSLYHVPEPNETPTEAGLAIPNSVLNTTPTSPNKIRVFYITAQGGAFSAKKLIVYQNDVVSVNFSAADDRIYNLSFPFVNVSRTAAAGGSGAITFEAVGSGFFDFFCRTCANSDKPKGVLIVKPKI